MKRVSFLLLVFMGLIAAFPQLVQAQDDIYYSPGTDTYNSPDYTTTDRYSDGNGDTYVTNNNYYYDNNDEYVFYDDYAYSSRIRRFSRPSSYAYYSPYYVDRYYYDFDPFFMGNTIYVNNWPSYERSRYRYTFYGANYVPWYLNRSPIVQVNIGRPWGWGGRYNNFYVNNYYGFNNGFYGYNGYYNNNFFGGGGRFNNGCPTAYVNNYYYNNDNDNRDRDRGNNEYGPRGGRGSGYSGGTTHGIVRTTDIKSNTGATSSSNGSGYGDSRNRGKGTDNSRNNTPTVIEYPTRSLPTASQPSTDSGRSISGRTATDGRNTNVSGNRGYDNTRPAPNTSKPARSTTNEYSKPKKNVRSIFGGSSKPSRNSKSYDSKPSRSSKSYSSKPSRSSRSYSSTPSRSSGSSKSYSRPSRSSSSKSSGSGSNRSRSSSSSNRGGR